MDYSFSNGNCRVQAFSRRFIRELRAGCIVLFVLCAFSVRAQESGKSAGNRYRDGIYTARADGYQGEIEVRVRIREGAIQSVEAIQNPDDFAQALFDGIVRQIIERQGTRDVDIVTGATITSRALLQAVEKALSRAKP